MPTRLRQFEVSVRSCTLSFHSTLHVSVHEFSHDVFIPLPVVSYVELILMALEAWIIIIIGIIFGGYKIRVYSVCLNPIAVFFTFTFSRPWNMFTCLFSIPSFLFGPMLKIISASWKSEDKIHKIIISWTPLV